MTIFTKEFYLATLLTDFSKIDKKLKMNCFITLLSYTLKLIKNSNSTALLNINKKTQENKYFFKRLDNTNYALIDNYFTDLINLNFMLCIKNKYGNIITIKKSDKIYPKLQLYKIMKLEKYIKKISKCFNPHILIIRRKL